MRKDKTKGIKINKILTISMSLVLFISLILTIVAVNYKTQSYSDVNFNATTDAYNSNQAYITETNTTGELSTVTMTEAYATPGSSYSGKVITIASDEELYLFSVACNEYSSFLAYNYKLLSNVYYEINSQFIPVGFDGTPFSGTFDGCGFEIANFKMVDITAQIGNQSTYANMEYYAMFAENTGTIKNLGLVESRNTIVSVELDNIVQIGGVANLVGHNQGTVTKCYYKDLRDMIEDEVGLAFYGGYRIAGLVYLNDGTFTDSYVAVSTVANHKINGYESICGICYRDNNYNDSSKSNNLFYFDNSISTYKKLSAGGMEITYDDEVFSDATFLYDYLNVGLYCSSVDSLNSQFENLTGWYYPAKYDSALTIYVKNETPILRGLSYTKNGDVFTFAVNSVNDFLYMFELMNGSDYFAEDKVIYQINSDINLKGIEQKNFIYKKIITSTITGYGATGTIQPTLITNSQSTYPTIYNFNCVAAERKTTTLGIDAYGLFPFLGGTVSYLNIIPDAISVDSIEVTNNVKGIAAVSGFVEKGTISNVNVYLTTTHTSTDIKEFYLGGIAGILAGEGTIEGCTVSGSYSMSNFTSQAPIASVYTGGVAIGGVVGYIDSTYGSIKSSLSAVNMTLNFDSSNVTYQIGGVVGAGYTISADGLENLGNISVGVNEAYAVYNALYVSGVIGRHLGVKQQVYNFTNQGNITVYGSNTIKPIYISGIENVDILTASISSTGLIASSDKTKDGKYRFRASSLTNSANIYSLSSELADVVEYTSGINVLTKNGFVSEISGVYNLNYTEKYESSSTKKKTSLGALSLDMNLIHRYANVVNVINASTPDASMTTTLTTVYNLRDLNVTPSVAIAGSYTYEYYGTVCGKYINYNDVRNEGKITSIVTKDIGATSDNIKIILAGVFEEVSVGCNANKIYNGENITFTYSNVNINADIYAAGICYRNKGYNTSTIEEFDPSSDKFDSKAEGALNNAINNGDILVDNPTNFPSVTYSQTTVMSANNQSYLGSLYSTAYSNVYNVVGDIYVSGITSYNEAPITNAFNLGDLFASNYINNTTEENEINVSGLINLNIGKYAYVLNSANNGTLKGINLSSNTSYLSNVNVAGIIARNDELENGTSYSSNTTNPNSSQIVSFTINYGDIYSYNYRPNIQTTSYEPTAKSAGIVAMGLLNTINVLNYGNIYGSETASGIFGVMYFSKFSEEVKDENLVYIANTINYGNVYMLARGYNYVHGTNYYDYLIIQYSRFKALTTSNIVIDDTTLGNNEAFISVTRNSNYLSVIGSVFSLANYATSANSANIKIRYLISFNDKLPIVGATVSVPTTITADASTLYSAHISTNAETGAYLNDTWINAFVNYAPLSTGSITDSFVTNIDSTGHATTQTKTYYGIFNNNFTFTQAILSKTSVDIKTNPTDAYLSDYFEFVGFKYINSVLFEKIGWEKMAYQTAAYDFATNVSNVMKVLGKASDYSSYSSTAKNAFSWMQNSLADDLNELIDSLIENEQYDDLLDVLEYIYSDDSQSSIYITKEVRTSVLNSIINNEEDLLSLLNTVLKYENGFSKTLAKSLVDNNDDVKAYIENYIDSMNASDITSMLDAYINYLETTSNSYFSYSSNEANRIELLNTLFANIDDATFYRELVSILGITDSSLSASSKMLAGYQSLTAEVKKDLFKSIIRYNYSQDLMDEYIDNMATDIDYYSQLTKNGFSLTSMSELYSRADLNSSSKSTTTSIINERIKLWNLIKDTTVFQNNFNTFGIPTKTYFKATEYNNTYQSVTEPHNGGTYVGDTDENRLSYFYTTEITPAVYFYGPYTDNSGGFVLEADDGTQGPNHNSKKDKDFYTETANNIATNRWDLDRSIKTYHALFHYTDDSLWNDSTASSQILLSRGGKNSTTTFADIFDVADKNFYNSSNANNSFPQLIYYDFNNEQLGGANDLITLGDSYYTGTFTGSFLGFTGGQLGKNGKSFIDPITNLSCSASDWCGTILSSNNYYMYVSSTGETFSLNNATMGPFLYSNGDKTVTLSNGSTATINNNRFYIQDSNGANHPVQATSTQTIQIGTMNNGTFTAIHTLSNFDEKYREIYSFITHLLGLRMYTSTVSTALHSTARTGIYRRRSGSRGNFSNYFTWKQSECVHVYTSQYIDYAHSDLLNLDGVLTEYDGKAYSTDEREIINTLFNSYFLTSSNYTKFRKLVQSALLESLGDDSTNGNSYIDSFFMTNIYSGTISGLNNKIPFNYLYKESGTTVQSYLNGLQSLSSDNKKLLIYGASSSQEKYIALIKKLKAIKGIETQSSYANYKYILDYLVTHSGYIVNDKVVLSNMSSLSIDELKTYLAAFDDTSQDVAITNLYDSTSMMSSYTGSVTYNQSTYDSKNYSYGFKFTSMTLTPASTDNRIILLAKSTGSSSTLTKGTDTVEVTTINKYYFETNGATSITITSNSDVIVYGIEFVKDSAVTNQSTTLAGTVNVDSEGATSFIVTKQQIESQISTAIINSIGNNKYYRITSYSVIANLTVHNTNGQQDMYFALSKTPNEVFANSGYTCYGYTDSYPTLTMQDSYYGQNIYTVYYRGSGSSAYLWSSARSITSVSYTITYSYITEGTSTTKNITSNTVNLYNSDIRTNQSYNSGTISVNATSVTIPSENDIITAIANSLSVSTNRITLTGLTGSFTITNQYNKRYTFYIYYENTNLGYTSINSYSTGTISNVNIFAYLGEELDCYFYAYNNYYDVNMTSYSYTATYTYDATNYTVSTQMPTESNVKSFVLSDSGLSSWNDSLLTINSVTAYITVRNVYGSQIYMNLYNLTDNTWITGLATQTLANNATYTYNLDLTQFYGKTLGIVYSTNNENWYYGAGKTGAIDSYYYTVNYTKSSASNGIGESVIQKNRLLNLDITYYDAINKYLAYNYNNSTNISALDSNFVKANLVNFAAINTSGNDSNPTNLFVNKLTDSQKISFARIIATNSNEALYYVIDALSSTNSDLGEVFKVMNKATNGYAFIADTITKLDNMTYGSTSTDLIDYYPNVLLTLTACYLVSDYRNIVDQGGSAYNTDFEEVVADVNSHATGTSESYGTAFNGNINYINADGSINTTKYNMFVEYILGQASATSSYGIFALASSRGIKNGAFIPDNVNLLSMDAKYDTTATDDASVAIIALTLTSNSSWRDETGSTTTGYDTSNNDSVNYHVRIEMKQLLKAISNVIFELDLKCSDTTLYSSTDQIDYENKIITYYVSETYFNYILSASTLKIVGLSFADTATSDKAVNDNITLTKSYTYKEVSLDSSSYTPSKYYTVSGGVYTLATGAYTDTKYYEMTQIDSTGAITIIPEETAYTASYTLRFIKIDTTITSFAYYSMKYLETEDSTTYTTVYTNKTIPYYGSVATFKVVASNLPNGMDLKSFFRIDGEELDSVWEFDPDTVNNGIVSNGEAYIATVIDISMSQGEKDFILDLYGTTKTVTIEKEANRNSLITSFGYDGTDYTSTMQSSKTASSQILFGRAFNYTDLTAPYILTTDTDIDTSKTYYVRSGSDGLYSYSVVTSPLQANIATYYEANEDFYLYSFGISSNAKVKISATKAEATDTKLMTYTVTYLVTSEYGTSTTYTHSLTEKLYFTDNAQYATLYKDGVAVDSTGIYTTDFKYDGATVEASGLSNLIYDADEEDNFVAVIFNRGNNPQYRIRYDISNFYGDISLYSVEQGSANGSVTAPQDTYAGITITVDEENEPGAYKYTYVYSNSGEWEATPGGYVKATTFDPSVQYYFDYGDGNLWDPIDEIGEEISESNFNDFKDDLVYYTEGSDPTYTRTYSFPALYIIKDYAVDALFHKLTFLDESVVLGGTASVMLPTTPISAATQKIDENLDGVWDNVDSDAVLYKEVFANYETQEIKINPNSIDYSDEASDVSVTDYYTVGTVSDTDLENYAPTITVEDHAQVFKYTTLTKLRTYGADNEQTVKDSTILTNRTDMLLYVPFVTGTGSNASYMVFMVLLDANMNWTKVYPHDFNGVDTNDAKVIHTFNGSFNTLQAEKTPSLTELTYDGDTYKIADFAGSTNISNSDSSNISLYMDYIGDPLEDHFWYISYVVFSEYYMNKGFTDANNDKVDDLGAVRYYHISIVDASNTVYYDVSLYAPSNFKLDDIYLTFAEEVYNSTSSEYLGSYQLSCYLEKSYDENNNLIVGASNTEEEGLVLYKLKLSMAALPAGYFYFFIDLPNGYGAICYTNKVNEIDKTKEPGLSHEGSYLPHTTIIPITIGLKIIVSELTGESSTVWAVNTSDLYTRQIEYKGQKEF